MDLKDIRQEYKKFELDISDLNPHPITQFEIWLNEAKQHGNPEHTAMTLSTVDAQNRPHIRVVLLKEVVQEKFRFFTNYNSTKGQNMALNPWVCLNFHWPNSERQVRVNGIATKSPESVSDAYFKSRPIGSQAGAIASNQSEVIESKDDLIFKFEKLNQQTALERPMGWGGYDVEVSSIEFWQGGKNRLHDRFLYQLIDGQWTVNRLAP